MDDITEKYLSQLLEGYENNIGQVRQNIAALGEQLEQLDAHEEDMQTGITELRELLGLKDEDEVSGMKLVEEEELVFDDE
jgi:hypothetical protein